MVCKKCGNDLKPGAKFCFNCGYYVDEDQSENESSSSYEKVPEKKETSKERKAREKRERQERKEAEKRNKVLEKEKLKSEKSTKKQNNKFINSFDSDTSVSDDFSFEDETTFSDFSDSKKDRMRDFSFDINFLKKNYLVIIAVVLAIISIVFVVLSFTGKDNNKGNNTPVIKDNEYAFGNVIVKISSLYNVDDNNDSSIYVSFNNEYSFSYSVNKAKYDDYSKDLNKLGNNLKKKGYILNSSEKKNIDGKEFIIYNLTINDKTKYFYLTKLNNNYLVMGIIDLNNAISIEESCLTILKINDSAVITDDDSSSDIVGSIYNILK